MAEPLGVGRDIKDRLNQLPGSLIRAESARWARGEADPAVLEPAPQLGWEIRKLLGRQKSAETLRTYFKRLQSSPKTVIWRAAKEAGLGKATRCLFAFMRHLGRFVALSQREKWSVRRGAGQFHAEDGLDGEGTLKIPSATPATARDICHHPGCPWTLPGIRGISCARGSAPS